MNHDGKSREELIEMVDQLQEALALRPAPSAQDVNPAVADSAAAYVLSKRLAHDLKAPARQIRQLSEQLRETFKDALDDDSIELILMIEGCSEKLHKQIDELRDYINAHIRPLDEEVTQLSRIIDDAASNLSSSIDITYGSEATIPEIVLDQQLMHLLFHNLLKVAYSFKKGLSNLEVQVFCCGESTSRVQMRILFPRYHIDNKDICDPWAPFSTLVINNEKVNSRLMMATCKAVCHRIGWMIELQPDRTGQFCVEIDLLK